MISLCRRLLPLSLLAVVVSCGGGTSASRDPEAFNVLIVVLDALRPDKLGCYGFERPTSPAIDAFAADSDSVLFTRHHVQGAFTKSSTASLFTGLFPFQHGVVEGHKKKDKSAEWGSVTTQILAPELDTLAEKMRARGFQTLGVVKSRHLVADYGFAQGFDEYYGPAETKGDASRLEKLVGLIDDAPGRFFGYVHFSATHHPYPPHKRDADYMRQFGFPYDEPARREAGVDFTTADVKFRILRDGLKLARQDVRFLNVIYEATVRRVDRELFGALIDALKERDLYDSTLIVLTADHGEELYDHQGYAHQYHVWQEIVHVPMIVKFPRGHRPDGLPDRVTDLTSAIDVLPSLAELVGFPCGEEPGAPMLLGENTSFAYSQAPRRWSLQRNGWKYSHDPEQPMLFDLRNDSGESTNLVDAEPKTAARLKQFSEVLFESARADSPVIETSLDADALRELRELGYLK